MGDDAGQLGWTGISSEECNISTLASLGILRYDEEYSACGS